MAGRSGTSPACSSNFRGAMIITRAATATDGCLHSGRKKMTRSWIPLTRGRFVRQARVGLGDLREGHLSRQGFAGPVAMLYRTDGPNEVVRFEGDYRPRQVDSADVVAPDATDPRGGWQTLLSNDDVAVAVSRRREAMPCCYRDMEGDLLYFVHRGHGVFA